MLRIVFLLPFIHGALEIKFGQYNLLYETDHEALLQTCRQMIKECREGYWNEEEDYSVNSNMHPDADKLPARILVLNPLHIWISKNYVQIEMIE